MKFTTYIALAIALVISAGARAVELQDLIKETQRSAHESGQVTMVWWMPQAFWTAAMNASTALSPEGRAQAAKALEDYTFFAVVRAKTLFGGGLGEAPAREELLQNVRLEIDGKAIEPLTPDSLSPTAQGIIMGFKPALARMAGQIGQSMQIIVYPARKDGKLLLDPTAPGGFKYTVYDKTFTWRLPLGSLLPPRFDPKTHEQFPGNFQFNPYTGTKLSATDAH
jgi:hypothetical protein